MDAVDHHAVGSLVVASTLVVARAAGRCDERDEKVTR
jgi:hypothetical protein